MPKKYLLEKQKELDDYKGETLKVIRGQSKLRIDLLNTLVGEAKSQIQEVQVGANTAMRSYRSCLKHQRG